MYCNVVVGFLNLFLFLHLNIFIAFKFFIFKSVVFKIDWFNVLNSDSSLYSPLLNTNCKIVDV